MIGLEYSGIFGERVVVLRECQALDTISFIDDLLFVEELPIAVFNSKYKPTGRVNTALKTLFNEKNFERKFNHGTCC